MNDIDNNIEIIDEFLAFSYDVSTNAIMLFIKINGNKPPLAYEQWLWDKTKSELKILDRKIKINKILK